MYLAPKPPDEYRRGQVIFDHHQPSDGLHRLVKGRVKLSVAIDGALNLIDIYTAGDFFGESGLLGLQTRGQAASAIEGATLMWWSTAEVEAQIESQPRLGVALIDLMVERCLDLERRLQSFALDVTAVRVARNLLRLAERQGVQQLDGSLRIPPLTHQLLSEYVGTSREIITVQMNYLRDQRCLKYSRRGIDIFSHRLEQHLRQPS